MNPLFKSREVAYYLGDSRAGLLFARHTFADEARTGARQNDEHRKCGAAGERSARRTAGC
ncbi:hypothetical protein ACFXPY_40580 [Streptomyces sp. NPDC059153]|uniref:hypothetical protein n=1 Tax=unclassified Streptomyces TaxID=2593676 RepID=UPI0036A4CDBF